MLDDTIRERAAEAAARAWVDADVRLNSLHPAVQGHVRRVVNAVADVLADPSAVAHPAPAPIVLPTVADATLAIIKAQSAGRGWVPYTAAQAVLDLVASGVRHWDRVEPGTLIKKGTHVRRENAARTYATEYIAVSDFHTDDNEGDRYYIDPATVPAEPEDPRVALLRDVLAELDDHDDRTPTGDALLILARLDALEADR